MIILIAESKTMRSEEVSVSRERYESHCPAGERYAAEIMAHIAGMDIPDIMAATRLSGQMASRLKEMAYEFPNKRAGLPAIEAFTGVVFRNFDYPTLSPAQKELTGRQVRIISSLYGWLRPEDVIKPYRMEFASPVAPDNTPLFKFWRSKVTIELVRSLQAAGELEMSLQAAGESVRSLQGAEELVRSLQAAGEREILNLLPADAAKCVDWKLVKRFADVWKVDIVEPDGCTVRSPHAGRLKALRGELLREIITNGITTARELATFSNQRFLPIPDYTYPDRIAFMV